MRARSVDDGGALPNFSDITSDELGVAAGFGNCANRVFAARFVTTRYHHLGAASRHHLGNAKPIPDVDPLINATLPATEKLGADEEGSAEAMGRH